VSRASSAFRSDVICPLSVVRILLAAATTSDRAEVAGYRCFIEDIISLIIRARFYRAFLVGGSREEILKEVEPPRALANEIQRLGNAVNTTLVIGTILVIGTAFVIGTALVIGTAFVIATTLVID